MADIVTAIVEVLKANVAVATWVDTRVFGGELPAAEASSMPRAAIVIRPSGGGSIAAGSWMEHDTQRLDVVCYGATPLTANLVEGAATRALRSLRRSVVSGVLIHWAETAGGYFAARDGDTEWPYAFRSFQVFHALQEV